MYFSIKKKKSILFIFLIFDSNYFEAIQAALFYKKNASKIFKSSLFMFLGVTVSYDKNKKIKLRENWLLKGVLKN